MFPIIECGLFQIQTFSVVLLAALFITILAGVKSQQNDILAVRWLIQKLLIILVAAGICGRLVSVVIMINICVLFHPWRLCLLWCFDWWDDCGRTAMYT